MTDPTASLRLARLVLRYQAGDISALNLLMIETQGWLHRYLCRLVHDVHVADDVLQEVFILIFRKLRFLDEPLAYRSWVYRIATRQAFRQLRIDKEHGHRVASDEFLAAEAVPEAIDPADPFLQNLLAEKIHRLSPNIQAVIVLHYMEGLSIRQIAEVLDLASGTVKSRLAYGLAQMRV